MLVVFGLGSLRKVPLAPLLALAMLFDHKLPALLAAVSDQLFG